MGDIMTERTDLLASIAATTADYRAGEIPAPTPDHVERWVSQFDAETQLPILREMDHVLKQTYFNKQKVSTFLTGLIRNNDLVGNDPNTFWKAANFLDIQQGGSSQHDLLSMFNDILNSELGFGVPECGGGGGGDTFIYIDDAIFTGGRVKNDLSQPIPTGLGCRAGENYALEPTGEAGAKLARIWKASAGDP